MLRALFIDFNAFFASVEQQERPELRGQPLAVVPMLTDHTSCIAASYEAKAFGVRTGTMVGDARRLCPGLRLIESRTRTYVEYHHRLIAAVESCVHVEHVLSIDEMVAELTGPVRERENAIALAGRIKERIRRQVGEFLRCSIGIAPNPDLAKTATDMQKPDGLVVLEKAELPQRLFALGLRELVGIGPRMEKRLREHGIYTVEQLCTVDRERLRDAWGGIEGERMYDQLRGEPVYRAATRRTTIGHSHVLSPALRTATGALSVLHRLLQKAAARMRGMHYAAGILGISLRYVGAGRWSDELGLDPTQDRLLLNAALQTLWDRRKHFAADPLAVGVTLSHLVDEGNRTPSLFQAEQKHLALNHVIDQLNEKIGPQAAYFGSAHEALKARAAPSRIAFSRVPGLGPADSSG